MRLFTMYLNFFLNNFSISFSIYYSIHNNDSFVKLRFFFNEYHYHYFQISIFLIKLLRIYHYLDRVIVREYSLNQVFPLYLDNDLSHFELLTK